MGRPSDYIEQDGCWNCDHVVSSALDPSCNFGNEQPEKWVNNRIYLTPDWLNWSSSNNVCRHGKCSRHSKKNELKEARVKIKKLESIIEKGREGCCEDYKGRLEKRLHEALARIREIERE